MKVITTEELAKRLESGSLPLFDVRGDIKFEKGHIPGAGSAPLGSLVFRVASVMNPDTEVVVYSDGGECVLAQEAAVRLEKLRMLNVSFYSDGLQGWQEAGRAVMKSANPKSHTWGPVQDCRPIVVDRERAYNGAFLGDPRDVEGAGG